MARNKRISRSKPRNLDPSSPPISLPPELFTMVCKYLSDPIIPRKLNRYGQIEYEPRFTTQSQRQYNDLKNLAFTCKTAFQETKLGCGNIAAFSKMGGEKKSGVESWLYEGNYGKADVDADVERFCRRVSAPSFESVRSVLHEAVNETR